MVRRHWTYPDTPAGARLSPAQVQALIARPGTENAGWGYERIKGELAGLGVRVSVSKNRVAVLRSLITKAGRLVASEELADDLGWSRRGITRTLEDPAAHDLVSRDSWQYEADPLWCVRIGR
jgi:hypothetical protein